MMRASRKTIAIFLFTVLMGAFAATGTAAETNDADTDVRIIEARVVEATEARISVIARTGVEHVIAIDGTETKVKVSGKLISSKDVRVGDIISIELDEKNPTKFAKNIVIALPSDSQVARVRPQF